MKRKTDNKGMAMVMVLCVMAVLLVLSLAMLLSASVAVAGAQRAAQREQSRLLAETFSEVVSQALEAPYADTSGQTENAGLRDWLRREITTGGWDYYNAAEAGHTDLTALTRCFALDGLPDAQTASYGDVTLELYWEWDSASAILSEETRYNGAVLVAAVTCERQGQAHTVRTRYELKCEQRENGTVSWIWYQIWRE